MKTKRKRSRGCSVRLKSFATKSRVSREIVRSWLFLRHRSRVQFQNVDAYVEKLKQVVAENAKFDIEISHEFAYGDLFSVRVPLDERAEIMARKILKEKKPAQGIVYGGGHEGHQP